MLSVVIMIAIICCGISSQPVPDSSGDRLLSNDTENYAGYKIYRVEPDTEAESEMIRSLMDGGGDAGDIEVDILFQSRDRENPTEVMVKPEMQDHFESFLNGHGIDYEVAIDDLKQSLKKEEMKNRQRRALLSDSKASLGSLNLRQFYTYDEMLIHLKMMAKHHPKILRLFSAGKSFEKRDIPVAVISSDGNLNKTTIVVDAGMHAREWIAHATALYVITQLVEFKKDNENVLENLNWVILPVVNPDGYVYSWQHGRMWRKTRKPAGGNCYGTDANRNFGFKWGGEGASKDSCSDTFRGAQAFSEPETRAVRDALKHFQHQVKFYLTLHSYGNYFLYPWGYSRDLPSNWKSIHDLAQAGADAIRKSTGRKYKIGSSTRLLYAAAGGSDDYARGAINVPYSITMELPRGGLTGFNPPASVIEKVAGESWVGIKAMAQHLIDERTRNQTRSFGK